MKGKIILALIALMLATSSCLIDNGIYTRYQNRNLARFKQKKLGRADSNSKYKHPAITKETRKLLSK